MEPRPDVVHCLSLSLSIEPTLLLKK
ncbi:hypothetical protein CCACVL1_14554, partial [Corchorus capsularis]